MAVREILQRWRGHMAQPVQSSGPKPPTLPAKRAGAKKRFMMAGLDPAVSAVHGRRAADPSDPS